MELTAMKKIKELKKENLKMQKIKSASIQMREKQKGLSILMIGSQQTQNLLQ